jgi:hypothetical protein
LAVFFGALLVVVFFVLFAPVAFLAVFLIAFDFDTFLATWAFFGAVVFFAAATALAIKVSKRLIQIIARNFEIW